MKFILLYIIILCLFSYNEVFTQIENVPVDNQVYEFLDRMGIRGILPLYSNTMIPLSRQEVARLLQIVDEKKKQLSEAERGFLTKFKSEFIHEIELTKEDAFVLLRGDSISGIIADKEKYIYAYSDSSIYLAVEFLGKIEHRGSSGDTYGSVNSTLEEYGGRIRGTIKNKLGFYIQATNGTLFGSRALALSDIRLKGNVKFNDLNSSNFDFAQAYLRADLGWFNIQFGREYNLIGTGYSDRLLLSNNAPVMDFLKLDFNYKSFQFVFLQGSLVDPYSLWNKYLAMHRAKFSVFDLMNIGISEMIIYQRTSPDFAYINPINFYKSSEHSLKDRDNAFLNLDLEIFPIRNYKLYGTWLIDDIDFKKMGTGWWGNEFAWQGGIYISDIVCVQNLDGVLEYTRIEPYVYSNRLSGNSFSNNRIGLGHHLGPNSDEWFVQISYKPTKKFRTWISYTFTRHGENTYQDGVIVENVGGDVMQGHREYDSEFVKFLDGDLVKNNKLQIRAAYEPLTNYFLSGVYEFNYSKYSAKEITTRDNIYSLKMQIEF